MIVLARHGATAGNLAKKYIGVTDEPLCPQGARILRARASRFPRVETLFVSPLRRCRETASILYPNLEQVVVPDFRECDFGVFEGKSYGELKDDPAFRRWLDTGGEAAPPGGEGRGEFTARTTDAFLRAVGQELGDVAVVAHGGTVMALLSTFAGGGFYDWQVKNGGGFSVRFDGKRFFDVTQL